VKVVHIPNILTVGRLISVPVTVWLMLQGEMTWAFWMFVAAGITDGVDGAVARLCDARTRLGAILDPLADKVLLVSIYVVLGWQGFLPSWLVVMIIFRDLFILGGALIMMLMSRYTRVDPLYIGKVNTFLQIVLAGVVLAELGLGLVLPGARLGLIWLVGASTALSGLAYLVIWGHKLAYGVDDAP
jgi:cardiolipin synthase